MWFGSLVGWHFYFQKKIIIKRGISCMPFCHQWCSDGSLPFLSGTFSPKRRRGRRNKPKVCLEWPVGQSLPLVGWQEEVRYLEMTNEWQERTRVKRVTSEKGEIREGRETCRVAGQGIDQLINNVFCGIWCGEYKKREKWKEEMTIPKERRLCKSELSMFSRLWEWELPKPKERNSFILKMWKSVIKIWRKT